MQLRFDRTGSPYKRSMMGTPANFNDWVEAKNKKEEEKRLKLQKNRKKKTLKTMNSNRDRSNSSGISINSRISSEKVHKFG